MIELRTLGALELRDAAGRELRSVLAQPKRLALLVYLVLASPRGFRRRDTMLALFWPELDDNHARNALRQAVHFLKRSLGEQALVRRGEEELAINAEVVQCDATAFERACDEGRLADALALYRGDLLDGFFVSDVAPELEEWISSERNRLRRRACHAAWTHAEQLKATGNQSAAALQARRAAALSLDDDETTTRRLVTLLDELGDRAGAVRVYEDFARRLGREYGVEPSIETKALIESVRSRAKRTEPAGASAERRAIAQIFTIERELGRTGVATVYLARELKHDRPVLLKVLYPTLASTLAPERFRREIAVLARLQHPHIHPLLDSGEADGLLFYWMPSIEGEALRERLARDGHLPLGDAVAVVRQVADALSYAHARGVVHRDVKPESILLNAGHATVTDFGIARAIDRAAEDQLTQPGVVLGTPAYMSPEQAGGSSELDARSDVYALGCVFYEMLAGEPPFTGRNAQTVMVRHRVDPPPSLRVANESIPERVDMATARALAKAPADRFATATDFTQALDDAMRGGP